MTANEAVISRRTAIGVAGTALVGALSFPGLAKGTASIDHSFVILLKGPYQPVEHAPDLGLSTVHLDDGSYSTTKIYPVRGLPNGNKHDKSPIGNFYVQSNGVLCAYQIPGGAFSMEFIGQDYVLVDDGEGGQFLEGTFELTILEATGAFRSLAGGHNHMVDKLHLLASGGAVEYCFCFISHP